MAYDTVEWNRFFWSETNSDKCKSDALLQFSGWPHVKCFWEHGRPCPNTARVCCADGRRWVAFGFCVGLLAKTWWCRDLDGAILPLIILLKQKYVRIQHARNLLQKKSIPRCSGVNAAERIKLGSQLTKPATRIIDCCYCTGFDFIFLIKIYQVFLHPAITVHPAITASMCIWNDGTVMSWRD